MGAQQSSTQDGSASNSTPSKTCYYELLGIEIEASDNEIKKAYRKRALELHPDRNLNDVESATARFAEVQAAYEVLSDPQERAWYDSHRDAILRGQDGDDDAAGPTTFRNVRLTSTEEILALMRKFNTAVPFDDEPTGFFGIARETFEHLALEEEAAAEFDDTDCPDYPTFGSSDDPYESVVKQFYNIWGGFSTKKSFSWKDKYRLADAPDRRVRRLMEKDNKKCREDAIREFNDAVRFLVTFVRKRDPRYAPNTQTDADRQKSMRDAAAAQAARSRAANQERMAAFEVPHWAQSHGDDPTAHHFSDSDDEELSELEILECVVCNKTFKSEKQLQAHERSKKHIKALQSLRREMRKEGAELDLDPPTTQPPSETDQEQEAVPATVTQAPPAHDTDDAGGSNGKSPASPANDAVHSGYESSDSLSDDYASRDAIEERISAGGVGNSATKEERGHAPDDELSGATAKITIEPDEPARKVGKAKAKRERKAASSRAQAEEHRCSVCATTFASRSKLFNHIREEDHAAAIPRAGSGRRKKMR